MVFPAEVLSRIMIFKASLSLVKAYILETNDIGKGILPIGVIAPIFIPGKVSGLNWLKRIVPFLTSKRL